MKRLIMEIKLKKSQKDKKKEFCEYIDYLEKKWHEKNLDKDDGKTIFKSLEEWINAQEIDEK